VVVRLSECNDAFIEAVQFMYSETPVRQGRVFWHCEKDFQTIKRELATYLERSIFLGAYYRDKLIGFMKITSVGTTAAIALLTPYGSTVAEESVA
jgi:hypothetical protein